eukprot:TRINITY_DN204_c0_g1_i1.p1 TRINITY_DN204_c0_g1~~TRINITY_DN204_c0_g1_i1.p1  ORF type:complete len:343 (+),score=66.58 TRINITY_DN204_c0_g1_i1:28-1029(+)
MAGPVPDGPDQSTPWYREGGDAAVFLTTTDGLETNQDLQALQALVYDGTPEEIAENFKNQGNKCVKRGPTYYEQAISYYSQALDQKLDDPKKNAMYLSNRAHVNLLLENYGYAFVDGRDAVVLDPTNLKGYFRAAKACLKLRRWPDALQWAQKGLSVDATNPDLLQIRDESAKEIDAARAREQQETKLAADVRKAIKRRGIRMEPPRAFGGRIGEMKPSLDAGELVWPIMIFIEVANICECAEAVGEEACLEDVLSHMYGEAPGFDASYKYSDRMCAYYPGADGAWHLAPKLQPLKKLLSRKDFVVYGIPVFHVVNNGTPEQKRLLATPPEKL